MWKPMLASRIEDKHLKLLRYPVLISPKLDGIRAMVQGGRLVSRNLKLIRNKHVQQLFGKYEYEGLDGELIFGKPTAEDVFRVTSSAVMSEQGTPDVKFWVFDHHVIHGTLAQPFWIRNETAQKYSRSPIQWVEHRMVDTQDSLMALVNVWIEDGYEGFIVRDPNGPYKQGRSSYNEGWLLKYKQWLDSEAEILEMVEKRHNDNEAVREITGRLKRSSHKENMILMNTLGSLRVRDIKTGVEFNIGSGLDDAQRDLMWANKEKFIGQLVKYKYTPIGVKDRPRHPIFLGIRDRSDIG